MRLVMDASKPCPEKLCGMPKIPNRKTIRVPTMSASFQRRFLFMTKTKSKCQVMPQLLGLNFFLGGGDLGDGGFGHFQHDIVGRNAQMNRSEERRVGKE